MNILIIGASGLVGENLANKLAMKHNVFALVRKQSSFDFKKEVNLVFGDLNNPEEIKLPTKIDSVYYIAQSRYFRNFPEQDDDIFNINVKAPYYFVKWAREHEVQNFIYFSSGGIYAKEIKPITENQCLKCLELDSFYLSSKLSAEMLLQSYKNFFKRFVILRPFFIYGPKQNKSMLIPRLIESVVNEKPITIYGKEGLVINPIFVNDVTDACIKLLDIAEGDYLFNIGGNQQLSILEISKIIGEVVAKKPIFKFIDKTEENLIGDIIKLKENVYVPKVDFRNGIIETYEYFRK